MTLVFELIVLVLSVIIHEVSHGLAANSLGDPTAKNMGRLSLNPARHIDLWGSIIIPLILVLVRAGFIIGWAKPVPFNPANLRHQRWGPALVAVAGPGANLGIAAVCAVFLRLVGPAVELSTLTVFALQYIVVINVWLALFNLLPLPPLDGSKIVAAFLPYRYERMYLSLEQYGLLLLIPVIIFILPLLAGPFMRLLALILGNYFRF
jgi:Zn-dependent protease